MMMLSSALPVPLRAAVPVSVRFSTKASPASEKLIDDWIVSVPSPSSLGHHVAHIVDHIGVVARAPEHPVPTGTAIEDVVAAQACQHVRRGGSCQGIVELRAGEVLEAAQRVGPGPDRVLRLRSRARLTVTPWPLAPDVALA